MLSVWTLHAYSALSTTACDVAAGKEHTAHRWPDRYTSLASPNDTMKSELDAQQHGISLVMWAAVWRQVAAVLLRLSCRCLQQDLERLGSHQAD